MSVPPKRDWFWLFVVLLSAFAVAPLLAPGYFWGAHDARHSVYFLVEFDRVFRDGILYPRWLPDFTFGYGYPLFNIYSPGVFYLGEALHLLGLDFVDAVKAVFALGFVLSGLTMYFYARRVLASRNAALVAATLYIYVPYHLADVFLRGALADSFCFVFFPLVLWGFHNLVEQPRPVHLVAAGAALAGLIFTHYALGLLFMPLLAAYILVLWLPRKDRLRTALWAAGGGLYAVALAAILVLPVALEYRYVRTDQWAGGYYNYQDHFVYFFQFFAPTWGYGTGSVAGPNDTLPFQLGVVPFVLSVLSILALYVLNRAGQSRTARLLLFYQGATLALLALMLQVSLPVWEILHLATFAQFPWRLLSLTAVTLAVLGSATVVADEQTRGRMPPAVLAGVLAVIVLGSHSYLQPEMIDPPEGSVSLGGLMRFQQSAGEMTGMTAWATRPRPPTWSALADVYVAGGEIKDKVAREILPPGVQAITVRRNSVLEEVRVMSSEPAAITFHTAYYPGWRATVDGQRVEITTEPDLGRMSVAVPAGEHTLLLRFEDTPPRLVGGVMSVAAVLAGLVILVRRR